MQEPVQRRQHQQGQQNRRDDAADDDCRERTLHLCTSPDVPIDAGRSGFVITLAARR